VAFSYAYFDTQYIPLQGVSTLFFVEFLARLTVGSPIQPVGVIARVMTLRQAPDWVSAKPKRFAWTLGLGDGVLDDDHHQQRDPRHAAPDDLRICLTLMWMESVLGLCLGCKIHALLVRRGWATKDPAFEICAHGECKLA
jgi:hypothetical protein